MRLDSFHDQKIGQNGSLCLLTFNAVIPSFDKMLIRQIH